MLCPQSNAWRHGWSMIMERWSMINGPFICICLYGSALAFSDGASAKRPCYDRLGRPSVPCYRWRAQFWTRQPTILTLSLCAKHWPTDQRRMWISQEFKLWVFSPHAAREILACSTCVCSATEVRTQVRICRLYDSTQYIFVFSLSFASRFDSYRASDRSTLIQYDPSRGPRAMEPIFHLGC